MKLWPVRSTCFAPGSTPGRSALAEALTAALLGVALWLTGAASARAQFFPLTQNVKMDDGVELTTDIWRNFLDDTPRPVLLRRTPYGRGLNPADVAGLMNAGFIVVSQDVRGKGSSGGTFLPFFDDKEDGRATIDWIATQPWSNGRVGTYSASAEGIVQYMAMAAAPIALSCSHVMMATPHVYQAMFPGGAWRTDLNTSWLSAVGAPTVIDAWKAHEIRDAYWDSSTLSVAEMAKVDHPVFVLGGFFDIFANDESKAAQDLQQNVALASRGDVFVVLGPWTHGSFGSNRQGELLYPDSASMPAFPTELLQYFNWCLLGATRPPYANVRYFLSELTDETKLDTTDNKTRLVARGEWRDSVLWPPAEARVTTLYLTGDRLLGARAADATPVPLPLDPADPTPSVGGGNFTTAAGPYSQASVDARADVFVSTSAPVEQETVLVGNPRAFIWAASATDDVDVVVRLEVVTSGGRAVVFADGIRRGRFVTGYDAIRPLVPNQPALFEVELGPIALRLSPGTALRVAISGASTPRYEANPNTAAPLASKPTAVKTTLTLFRDAEHPSRIALPLLSGAVPGGVLSDPPKPAPAMDGGVAPSTDAGRPGSRVDARVPATGLDAASEDDPDVEPEGKRDDGGCRVAGSHWQNLDWLLLSLGLLAWSRRRLPMGARATSTRVGRH